MKGLWFPIVLAVTAGVAVAHPDAVQELYEQLYPGDPAKREALEQCFMADYKFNRLNPSEREACYKRKLAPPPVAAAFVPPSIPPRPYLPQVNQVDLRRSAAQGRMPQNDVRFQQQTERYLHPGSR